MKISQINAAQIVKLSFSDEYDNEYQIHGNSARKILETLKTITANDEIKVIFKRCAGVLDD